MTGRKLSGQDAPTFDFMPDLRMVSIGEAAEGTQPVAEYLRLRGSWGQVQAIV